MSTISMDVAATDQCKYLETQLTLARREISNLRQQLKTLNHVHKKECEAITQRLETWRCLGCNPAQNRPENEGEASAFVPNDLTMKQVGVVSTNFPEKRGTPRQPGICSDAVAKLTLNNEIFTNPSHSVQGLQEFSHMWILFHFHKNESTHVRAKVAPPRLNGVRTGVFATRSPHRPSPIGLSLVKIERIVENAVYFSGVDMIDQTPVLDIKPYIPQYDNPTLITIPTAAPNFFNFQQLPSTSAVLNIEEPLDNLGVRVMDGEENSRGATSLGQSSSRSTVDELLMNVRIGEREAPDGEEEETPSNAQPVSYVNIPTLENNIRVPSWIDQPPVHSLVVSFKDRALSQLLQLGAEGEQKKSIIANVLKEDPRSIYLRERWGTHCYVFRISDLYVSCKFNDVDHTVTVYQVFLNSGPENDE